MTHSRLAGLPWPGGGPWAVLADCPSPHYHNSVSAARGRGPQYKAGRTVAAMARDTFPKCICPRALLLKDRDNERRRGRSKANGYVPAERERVGAWVPQGVRMPDLSEGLCTSMLGRRIMDNALNGKGTAGESAAKALCGACPVRDTLCKPWVLAADPDAMWPGVWAGLTRRERQSMIGQKRARKS